MNPKVFIYLLPFCLLVDSKVVTLKLSHPDFTAGYHQAASVSGPDKIIYSPLVGARIKWGPIVSHIPSSFVNICKQSIIMITMTLPDGITIAREIIWVRKKVTGKNMQMHFVYYKQRLSKITLYPFLAFNHFVKSLEKSGN